jgi:hypothetical protein
MTMDGCASFEELADTVMGFVTAEGVCSLPEHLSRRVEELRSTSDVFASESKKFVEALPGDWGLIDPAGTKGPPTCWYGAGGGGAFGYC